MLVGYARVSKNEQSFNRQIYLLVAQGIDERNIYKEKITGTYQNRPELNRLIQELKTGDTVVVSELTRLSRSTKDLFSIVEQIEAKQANIKSLKENWLDTTTPQGKLLLTIFAGLSQFECDLISERTKEGLRAAKARGRKGGRPSKQNEKRPIVELMYKNNPQVKISEIVKITGVSTSTAKRILKQIKGSQSLVMF